MIHLVVCEGRRVRDPKTKQLVGPKGVKVDEIDTYWFRRLRDGDVKIADAVALVAPAAKPAPVQPKKSAKEKGE